MAFAPRQPTKIPSGPVARTFRKSTSASVQDEKCLSDDTSCKKRTTATDEGSNLQWGFASDADTNTILKTPAKQGTFESRANLQQRCTHVQRNIDNLCLAAEDTCHLSYEFPDLQQLGNKLMQLATSRSVDVSDTHQAFTLGVLCGAASKQQAKTASQLPIFLVAFLSIISAVSIAIIMSSHSQIERNVQHYYS